MSYYLFLQFTRLKRWFKDLGIYPVLGFLICIIGFVLISSLLFIKTEWAKWIFSLFAFSLLIKCSSKTHNKRLKKLFNTQDRRTIRLIENIALMMPFVVFLIYKQHWTIAGGLILSAIIMAFSSSHLTWNKYIPTPFKRRPFELIMGFRQVFLLFILLYFVSFKAIQVDNYNLGIVTLAALFFVSMSFYAKPEPSYFVWIYSCKPAAFIKAKLVDALIGGAVIAGPVLIAMLIFFPANYLISIVVFFIGMLFLLSMIFAKYSAYPNPINLPQGILYAISLWFPPMLIIIIPLFYKQSKRKLDTIL